MVASSITSPEPTTQKPMSLQTSDRPEDLYHPVFSSKSIKMPAAAPKIVEDGEDATAPVQVASASPSDDISTSTPDSTAPTELEGPVWAKPFLRFLIEGTLPQDVAEARHISRRYKAFTVINRQLYKRSITQILQKCIDEEDGKALLLEIHEGTCGHHTSSRVLVSKAFRAGFYWPTATKNAE